MCNLYSMTRSQAAIIAAARVMVDKAGNLPPAPGIFPDYAAPIVRNTADGRELAMARWGMPSPVFALKGRNSDPGVTNVRNTASPHWRRWLIRMPVRCAAVARRRIGGGSAGPEAGRRNGRAARPAYLRRQRCPMTVISRIFR
jgi:putative SOS response-associated peptidase YedK